MFRRYFLTALTSTSLFVAPAFAEDAKLEVVASFSILGDLAANVGGDRIALTTLVGPDEDAHAYEPRPDDAVVLSKAKVVLVNGLGFEGFMDRLAKTSATKATMVEVSKGAETITPTETGHEGHESEAGHDPDVIDPHAFQSVPNVRKYVGAITDAFCATDQAGCETYKMNAAAYDVKLEALDKDIRETVAGLPADKRTIITSHDAFGYFAHEYGVTFLAPEGVSTASEASAADVAKLIDQVREDKAAAIFIETISDPRLVNQIAAETGTKVGGALYSDALSKPDGPAPTYIDMMRYNISTIKGAITGS